MLVQLLNKNVTRYTRYIETLGISLNRFGMIVRVPEQLSKNAASEVHTLLGEIDSFSKWFWLGNPNATKANLIFVTIATSMAAIFGIGIYIAMLLEHWLPFILGIILAFLPIEIWTLITVMRIKAAFADNKTHVTQRLREIYADNRADLELAATIPKWILSFQSKLSANDLACDPSDRVRSNDDSGWRVVDVQASATKDSITGRDITIFVKNENGDARMLIQPSRETVKQWFSERLENILKQVRRNTHTMNAILDVDVEQVLSDVWKFPSDLMTEAASLKALTEQDTDHRPPMEIYGPVCDEGQVLLAGLHFEERKVLYAPTQTVMALVSAVNGQLANEGAHPSLLELENVS